MSSEQVKLLKGLTHFMHYHLLAESKI